MNFPLGLHLDIDQQSSNKLVKQISIEIANQIYNILQSRKNYILKFCSEYIKKELEKSPEIQSLLSDGGKLKLELGVDNKYGNIDKLIDYISRSINIKFSKNYNNAIDYEVIISISSSEAMKSIYGESFASYTTEKDVKIEWLKWLLEAGDQDVIFGYRVRYGVDVGRAGDAVMIKSGQANWRVPPEFSGTIYNNFITRSLASLETDLSVYIEAMIS